MNAMSNHDNSPQQVAQEKAGCRRARPSCGSRRLRIPSQMDFFLIYQTQCFPLLTHTKFLLEKEEKTHQSNQTLPICVFPYNLFSPAYLFINRKHIHFHVNITAHQGVFSGTREGAAATPGSLQALGTCQHCLLLSFTEGTGSPSRAACSSGVQRHSPLSQLFLCSF